MVACLNERNKEVAALLDKYTQIFGSYEAAYAVVSRNDNLPLNKMPVHDVNGKLIGEKDSKLYADLLAAANGDEYTALENKRSIFTKEFADWAGTSVHMDENGEPLLQWQDKSGDISTEYTKGSSPVFTKVSKGSSSGNKRSLTVAPYWNQQFTKKNTKKLSDEARDNFLGFANHFADLLGVEITNVSDNIGGFQNEYGFRREESYSIELSENDPEKAKILTSLLGVFGWQVQDAVISSKRLDESSENYAGREYFISCKVEDKHEMAELLEKQGFSSGGFTVTDKGIQLFWFEGEGTESHFVFLKKVDELKTEVNGNLETHKVESDYLERELSDWGSDGMRQVLENALTKVNELTSNRKDAIELHSRLKEGIKRLDEFKEQKQSRGKTRKNKQVFFASGNTWSLIKKSKTSIDAKIEEILKNLYPGIQLGALYDPNLRGQAIVEGRKAGSVLINAALRNADTLPHEYAHHYIAWFRNSEIVQKGIKMFGGEEELVQAIGENVVRAVKWYTKFFNWIKGLFSSKQKLLNELTKDFLNNTELDDSTAEIESAVYNQLAKESEDNLNKFLNSFREATKTRIRELSYAGNKDKVEQLKGRTAELERLERLETEAAVFRLAMSFNDDIVEIDKTLDRIGEIVNKGDLESVPNSSLSEYVKELNTIKRGFIDFYNGFSGSIQNILNKGYLAKYKNLADETEIAENARTEQMLKNALNRYAEVVRRYNGYSNEVAKAAVIKEATKNGAFSVDVIRNILENGDTDISTYGKWLMSAQYSNSELVRLITNKIINVKNDVADHELRIGKKLVNLMNSVSKSDIMSLFERDSKGHKTGFMTRDLNYGVHYQQLKAFQRELADKLGFADVDVSDVVERLTEEQAKTWYSELNKWHAKYSIRKFRADYYAIANTLSKEARRRRTEIDSEISALLSKVTRDGVVHREELSDEDYALLSDAETRKRNLANPFYADGTVKVGIDKQIADEIRKYNETLRKNFKYVTRQAAFEAAKEEAKRTLSPEMYKKWLDRNTVTRITEEFWKEVSERTTGAVKSQDQLLFEAAKRELLKLYMDKEGKIDAQRMPDSVKRMINDYDEAIKWEVKQASATRKQKSTVSEIADWVVSPEFYKEQEKAKQNGRLQEWNALNTITSYDSFGHPQVQPASFWKKLEPKEKLRDKYVVLVPNRSWSEIDKSSPFYDSRFDKYADRGESTIPNPKYFDNSKAFNKIKNNKKLFELYTALTDTMQESNDKLHFVKYRNKYLLPQIEGRAFELIKGHDNVLKGLGYVVKDLGTVKDDDDEYVTNLSRRTDGSIVKLVPTRYMKMLSDPNLLTDDIVGSIIKYYKMAENFKLMSEIAPELELILDSLENMKFYDKKGGQVEALKSNTYGKIEDILNRLLYGMREDSVQFGKVNISKVAKNIASYARAKDIGQNIFVILTGMVTSEAQNQLEALSGVYYDNSSLHNASRTMMSAYSEALGNIGNSQNKGKVLSFLEYLGITRSNEMTFDRLNQSRVFRFLNQHFWYGGHELGDFVIKGRMALSIAYYNRYDPESNEFLNKNQYLLKHKGDKNASMKWEHLTTLYDALDVDSIGLITPKKGFEEALVKNNFINKIKNQAKQVGTKLDTQLTDADRTKFHANTLGMLISMFRNFLLVNIDSRFAQNAQYNYATGMYGEATEKAALHYIQRHWFNKEKLDALKNVAASQWDEMDDYEKRCFKRCLAEFLVCALGGSLVALALSRWADNDDDDTWTKEALAFLALRSAMEMRNNLFPYEIMSLFTSPTAAYSTVESWLDTFEILFGTERSETVRSGPYKGLKRWQKSLIKASPVKSIYEAKDPKSRRAYYENMILPF